MRDLAIAKSPPWCYKEKEECVVETELQTNIIRVNRPDPELSNDSKNSDPDTRYSRAIRIRICR